MGKSYGPQLSFIYSSKCSKGGKCDGAGRLLLLLPVLPGDRQCHASRHSCHTLGGISGTSPPPLAPTSNPALALLLLTPKSIPICLLHCQSFPEFPLFPLCCSHLQTGPPSLPSLCGLRNHFKCKSDSTDLIFVPPATPTP